MPAQLKPLRVVSVSLGSSSRDKIVTAEFLEHEVQVERRGTDGDMARAISLIRELDGKVDAIGLGGIDLYLIAGGKRYVIREALQLAQAAKVTPVVDGSGLKHTLERRTVQWLQETGTVDFREKRVLLVSGVDRFGMAEVLPEVGAITRYGDLIFALGIPYPIKTLAGLRRVAKCALPIITRVPFSMLYPTGDKQTATVTKYASHFDWADIIAGDWHYMRRYMPARLDGKIVITNTTTPEDINLLRERGVAMLISSTPNFDGRSFGTNVMEGVIIALTKKRPEEMTSRNYEFCLQELGWHPNIVRLQNEAPASH